METSLIYELSKAAKHYGLICDDNIEQIYLKYENPYFEETISAMMLTEKQSYSQKRQKNFKITNLAVG